MRVFDIIFKSKIKGLYSKDALGIDASATEISNNDLPLTDYGDSQIVNELKGVDDLEKVFHILTTNIGENILGNRQLYNVINDLSVVFRVYPQYKYIVKNIIDCRSFNLIKLKTVNATQLKNEACKFSNKTGFNELLVHEVFIAIANGLGNKCNSVNIPEVSLNDIDESIVKGKDDSQQISDFIIPFFRNQVVKATNIGCIKINSSDNKAVKQLKDRIYIIPQWNDSANVKFENICITKIGVTDRHYFYSVPTSSIWRMFGRKSLMISCKVTGLDSSKIKKCYNHVEVGVFAFDINGNPIFKSHAWFTKSRSSYFVSDSKYAIDQCEITLNVAPADIGGILIVPMYGHVQYKDGLGSISIEDISTKFKGQVKLNLKKSRFGYLHDKPIVYGRNHYCSMFIPIEGNNQSIEHVSLIALFYNINDSLLDKKQLLSVWGDVNHIYFCSVGGILCDFSEVAKVIIEEE